MTRASSAAKRSTSASAPTAMARRSKRVRMPTSLRFAEGKFKNGTDPFRMYQTLTHGFGMMTPQTWMVPQQKYDVIHYIRETYLKPHNPSQYVKVDDAYLAGCPRGTSAGPKPSNIEPWVSMNYGPSLMATLEVGDEGQLRLQGDRRAAGQRARRRVARPALDAVRSRHAAHRRRPGAARASSTGTASISTAGTRSIRGLRARCISPIRSAPAGPTPRPADSTIRACRAAMANRTDRCRAAGRSIRGLYHYGNQTILSYTVGDAEDPGIARLRN